MALLPDEKHRRPLTLFPAMVALFLPGCLHRKTGGTVAIPNGPAATQTGQDVAAGATVGRTVQRTQLPLPAGSRVEIPAGPAASTVTAPAGPAGAVNALPAAPAPAPFVVTLAAPSTLTQEATTQTASGPTTHAPPAPPTPAQHATAAGLRLFYYIAAGAAMAAFALLYLGYFRAALVAILAAGGLPLLAQFSAAAASHTAAALAALAGGLVAAWHFLKSRIADPSK